MTTFKEGVFGNEVTLMDLKLSDKTSDSRMGFSKHRDSAGLAKRFDQVLEEMMADGSLDVI